MMPKRNAEVTEACAQQGNAPQDQITEHDIADVNRELSLHYQFARSENLAARGNDDAHAAIGEIKADHRSSPKQEVGRHDTASRGSRKLTRALAHLNEYPAEYVQRFADLIALMQSMDLTAEDIRTLLVVLSRAHTHRLSSEEHSDFQAVLAKSVAAVQGSAHAAPIAKSIGGRVPPLSKAPCDTFRGVRHDGDPYIFLMEHFGPWLQDGRKCLDRPTLKRLDRKLMKALEQRYTRGDDTIPPLSQIFPSKTEAARNLHIEAAA